MQATQLPEPAAVPVQRPASPALAPALRTISGETPHYRARFEVAAADGADAAEAVKEIVMGWLPIVLMTTDDDGKTPVWDATELASKLVGMATVYVIDMRDGALVQAFRDLLPDRTPAGRYRIGRSAVMVYRPGIDLSGEESLSACTLFTRHRIERYAAGGRDGFINVLMQGLGRGIDARPGDVAGIGDVLWLRSRVESERQGERIERLRSRAKAAAESVADIDGLRAENARLRADAEAWEEIATDQERSYSDATAKVDELTFSESSATRARADLMKMRERSYGGRTVDISAHIKGRSQKNTFRLHFYIDRENELIVIGHAGCHMKTAGSHRRGFK